MAETLFLDPVKILIGANHTLIQDAVLICNGRLNSFGKEARDQAKKLGLSCKPSQELLLAPCLVDPHSILESPFNNRSENIESLVLKAAEAGYGQLALMPRAISWRDRSELLQGIQTNKAKIYIHLWGSFSLKGEGKKADAT